MANPAKNIHAIRSGTGSLTTTRIAMTIPAIIMIIIPIFVALLKSFIIICLCKLRFLIYKRGF
ncbi:MAG: hypothetical protein IKG17_03705, partial [Mogibacterium sp.]|nr:hypothetical protein [Mogibacterium sp.]